MAKTISDEHKAKLVAAAAERREKINSGELTVERKNPIQRSAADPTSLRKAVDAKCYDCVYDQENNGSWREQTEACTCVGCPIWKIRPLSKGRKND